MWGNRTRATGARTAIAVALCVLGWGAAPALADPSIDFAPGSAPMQQAQTIAQNYWGTSACGGNVSISWISLPADINASSAWANPVSQYGAPAQNTECSIVFNDDSGWTWTKFCSVAVHEYGHLTGHQHTTNPDDVMYPYYVRPVPACAAVGKAQAQSNAAAAVEARFAAALQHAGSAASSRTTAIAAAEPRAQVARAPRRARLVAVKAHRHHGARHRRLHRHRVS